jgi:hypothetical protein
VAGSPAATLAMTTEPPAAAPMCTPPGPVSRSTPAPGVHRHRCCCVGSSVPTTRTPSSPTESTESTWTVLSVTGSPSTTSRRAPSSPAVVTRRPSGSRAGTPATTSSHTGSDCASSSEVAPVAGSTARTSARRWSRDITCTTAPAGDQEAAVR